MEKRDSGKTTDGKVINLSVVREAKIEERRRKYERVLFKNILGVYCVAEKNGLKAVELVDVSAEGLSFQLPHDSKHLSSFAAGKEHAFRFYFSQDSFISVPVKVQNQRPCIEEGNRFVRFGCSVDTSAQSYEAYKLFVLFLEKYAATCQQDKGDGKFMFF